MRKPDSVSLADLATLLKRIAAEYRQRGIVSVDLSTHDVYRTFGTNEMFDVCAAAPSPVGIGPLYDDIAELAKVLDDRDLMPTAVDIERLGNVLRAASEVV